MDRVETLCSNFPLYSEDLGIDIKKPSGRFRWFLASILFGTATKLLRIMKELNEKYGSLEKLYANSRNTDDLKSKLMGFKGIGEVTSQIFLRELRGVWKIDVPVSVKAAEMAERMNINLEEFEGEKLTRIEDALVKFYLRYGKKGKHPDTLPADILALMKT